MTSAAGETSPKGPALSALDPAPRTLKAGDLRAVFLPERGMLCASLRQRGEELLGRVEDLPGFARSGRTCGIPLLHPWANRLDGTRYRAAGQEVVLDGSSALIGHDEAGRPMHGVPWSRLTWRVTGADSDTLEAVLEWTGPELLGVFPFPHRLEMAVALRPGGLTVDTTLAAAATGPVPVSFGFHPYLRIPGLSRTAWRVELPAMRRLLLDERNIPTGAEMPFDALDIPLDERDFDDSFVLLEDRASFSVAGGGRRITVEFLGAYPYAQVFAPRNQDYIAFEPMTAPANSLISVPPVATADFEEHLERVVKVAGVSDDHDTVARCEKEMQEWGGTRISAERSQPYYLDVTHPNATKGYVVLMLSEMLAIPPDQIATIGDMPNDVRMFEKSGISIAMGNASDEVRQAATWVTTSCDDEGFANAMEWFVLQAG
jgi:aldose 1-epimerase